MSEITLPRTFRQLLGETVDAGFRQEVIEAFLQDKEAKGAVQEALQTIAALRKLRPQTIAQFGRPERIKLFQGVLSQAAMENPALQALQVWFLRKGRPLMGALLDAWKVEHTEGELEDDAVLPELTADDVRAAVQGLGDTYPKQHVIAYLAYNFLAAPVESWSTASEPVLLELLSA